jgi:ABC-type Fe3+ transport system substrate-binding protein
MAEINIEKSNSIYEITEKYPQTIVVFSSNGFPQMEDAAARETMGRAITLEQALAVKGKDLNEFMTLLVSSIETGGESVDVTLHPTRFAEAEVSLTGLVPCPIRLPLLEAIDTKVKALGEEGLRVNYDLKAASQGARWMEEHFVGDVASDSLPDVFISAGFESFFDDKVIGRFIKNGTFVNPVHYAARNEAFKSYDLVDPQGNYGIISIVPAVFLVNTNLLDDLPVPSSWEELLSETYYGKVALPVEDFDLFSAVLVTIFKMFGEDGVRRLANLLSVSMHPATMASQRNEGEVEQPAITIMPYFFTKMAGMTPTLRVVWPSDGAIVSPIFLLAKRETADLTKPLTDFLSSEPVGEVLAHHGLFPSLNPNVDNRLKGDCPLAWIGWDYIYENDIMQIIRDCFELFDQTIATVSVS